MNRGERERETNKQTNHPKIIAHIRTRGNTAAVCVCVCTVALPELISLF
jgi:hypothetical protein